MGQIFISLTTVISDVRTMRVQKLYVYLGDYIEEVAQKLPSGAKTFYDNIQRLNLIS